MNDTFDADPPAWETQTTDLLNRALPLLASADGRDVQRFREAAERFLQDGWRVLVSGLCSVGKSSFVGALWGDATMLPTAVRDCTQTNTLIRVPAPGETGRRLQLSYLTREQALDYATRDLSYFRLAQLLTEINGPFGAQLEEQPPEQRLRSAVGSVRKLFEERPSLFVLHEPLTEELEKLEQFLEFLGAPQYRPGETVEARWEDRRELLMGHRRPDGRTLDVGKLLALRHVTVIQESSRWGAHLPPHLIDSPWIPTYHNARRADLILAQAREADILVVLALPDRFELEPWVLEIFRTRPELLRRTLIVFNQTDTVDSLSLFSRDGFANAFAENAERFGKLGLSPENLFITCARLPFLELNPDEGFAPEFIPKLKKVLARLAHLAAGRPESLFKRRLLEACAPADGGLESVRARLETLRTATRKHSATDVLRKLAAITPLDVPAAERAAWNTVLAKSAEIVASRDR